MIKSRAKPAGGCVARGTSRREAGSDVIRNVSTERNCALPCGCVATVAIRRKVTGIVVVDVASGARSFRRIGVSAGQREAGRAVIKFSVSPCGDWMARRAHGRSAREASGDVIRCVPTRVNPVTL